MVQFPIAGWYKFDNKDTDKKVAMWHVKVVQKIMFDLSPAVKVRVSDLQNLIIDD